MVFRSLLVSAFVFASASASVTNCGAGKSQFQPTELAISPESPAPGDKVDMTVKFNNPGPEVNAGTVTTSVTYNFIPFQPTTEDLCVNTPCPLVVGANDRSTTSTWPDVTGLINTHIEWTDTSGALLLCLDVDVATGGNLRGNREKNLTVNDLFALYDVFHNNTYHLLNDLYSYGWAEEKEYGEAAMADPVVKDVVVWKNYTSLLNARNATSF